MAAEVLPPSGGWAVVRQGDDGNRLVVRAVLSELAPKAKSAACLAGRARPSPASNRHLVHEYAWKAIGKITGAKPFPTLPAPTR